MGNNRLETITQINNDTHYVFMESHVVGAIQQHL